MERWKYLHWVYSINFCIICKYCWPEKYPWLSRTGELLKLLKKSLGSSGMGANFWRIRQESFVIAGLSGQCMSWKFPLHGFCKFRFYQICYQHTADIKKQVGIDVWSRPQLCLFWDVANHSLEFMAVEINNFPQSHGLHSHHSCLRKDYDCWYCRYASGAII